MASSVEQYGNMVAKCVKIKVIACCVCEFCHFIFCRLANHKDFISLSYQGCTMCCFLSQTIWRSSVGSCCRLNLSPTLSLVNTFLYLSLPRMFLVKQNTFSHLNNTSSLFVYQKGISNVIPFWFVFSQLYVYRTLVAHTVGYISTSFFVLV